MAVLQGDQLQAVARAGPLSGKVTLSDSMLPLRCAERGAGLAAVTAVSTRRVKSAPGSPNAGRRVLTRKSRSSRAKRSRPKSTTHWRPPCSARLRQKSRRGLSANPRVIVIQTPGYSLARSASAVEMNINVKNFFNDELGGAKPATPVRYDRTKSVVGIEVLNKLTQESILKEEKLQREVVDLTLQIEEDKEQHLKQLDKAQEEFNVGKKQLQKLHDKQTKSLKVTHDLSLKQVHERHQEELQAEQARMKVKADQFREEIVYMNKLLETTKTELAKETEERVKKLKQMLNSFHAEEVKLLKETIVREKEEQMSRQLQLLKYQHCQEMEDTRARHGETLKTLIGKFSDAKDINESFQATIDEIQQLKVEKRCLENQLKEKDKERLAVEVELLKTQQKLSKLQKKFDERVKQAEEKISTQIDQLREENSYLRRRMLQQAEELADLFSRKTATSSSGIAMRLKAVVQARIRANLSLVGAQDQQLQDVRPNELELRPKSAPVTIVEDQRARISASSAAGMSQR